MAALGGTSGVIIGVQGSSSGGLSYTGVSDVFSKSITMNGNAAITNSGGALTINGTFTNTNGVASTANLSLGGSGMIMMSSVIGNRDGTHLTGLIKENTGTLILTGTNTYTGVTTIRGNNGTLGEVRVTSIGNGGVAGNLGQATNVAGNIVFGATGSTTGKLVYLGAGESTDRLFTINGNAIIENNGAGALNFTNTGSIVDSGGSQSLTFGGSYSGSANTFAPIIANKDATNKINVIKNGPGTWTLSGASTYTGTTAVNAGRLNLTGSLTSDITVASGAALSGTGSTTGNITFTGGSAIIASATGANAVQCATATGTTRVLVMAAPTGSAVTLNVLRYTGTDPTTAIFSNAATNFRSGSYTDAAGNISLTYTGNTDTWSATAGGTWDLASNTPWTNASADNKFYWGDAVVFGNTAASQTVTLASNVAPVSITVSNAANTYTFGGTTSITGPTGITKTGAGTLYINNSGGNSYFGKVDVQGGTLQIGVAAGLGSGTAVNIGAGNLLRYSNGAGSGFTSTGHTITLNDGAKVANFGGNAAVVITVADNFVLNSATTAAQIGGFSYGNSAVYSGTISGTGNLQITNVDGGGNGGIFKDGWKTNSYTGNTTISGLGEVVFQASAVSSNDHYTPFGKVSGSTSGNVTVSGGQSLTFTMPSGTTNVYIDNNITLDNATLTSKDSYVHLAGTLAIGAGGASLKPHWDTKSLYVDGVMSGSGAVTISTSNNNTSGIHFTNSANTYSGTMTVSSSCAVLDTNTTLQNATISIGATNGLQFGTGVTAPVIGGLSGASNESIAGVALTVGGANGTTTYSGILSGASGSLTKTGTGTLTLSNANTYTGTTTVNNGRINLTGSLTSATTVKNGAVLSGTGSTTGALTMQAGSKIALPGGATTTSLTSAGVTFSGATAVIFDSAPTTSTTYDVLTYGGTGATNPGNLSVFARGTLTQDGTNNKFTFTATGTASRTWNTTTGTWENGGTSTNWVEGDQKFYDFDTVSFGDIASDSTVTLSGTLQPASVSVSNAANKYTFTGGGIAGTSTLSKSGAGTLALNGTNTYTGTTTISGGTLQIGGSTNVGSGTVSLTSSSSVFQVLNGGSFTTTGALSSGNTGAKVQVDAGGSLSVGSLTHSYPATVVVDGTLTSSGKWLYNTGGGSNNITGGGTASLGDFEVGNGATVSFGMTGSMTVSGNFFLVDNYTYTTGTFTQTAGTVNLTTSTAENIRIGHWSGSTGTVNVQGGTFNALNSDAVVSWDSAGKISVSGGTANLRGVKFSSGTRTNAGTLELTGGTLNIGAGGIYDGSTGANTITITLGAGTLGALTNWSSSLAMGLTAATTTTVDTTGGNITLSGVIGNSTSGALTKAGTGTLTLSGANTYTGVTTVKNGTLALTGGGDRLATSGLVVLGDTSTSGKLVLGDSSAAISQTLAGLTITGSGGRVVGGNASNSTLTLNIASGNIFGGVLGGAGTNENNLALTKTGSGVLMLSGLNTYTGSTTVSVGTLEIAAGGALLGTSSVVVAPGATLKNDGTVSGSLIVDVGGVLSGVGDVTGSATILGTHTPGDSPGTQSFHAGLTYNDGAILEWEFSGDALTLRGTDYDGIDVTSGDLTIGNPVAFRIINYGTSSGGVDVNYAAVDWDVNRTFTVISLAAGSIVGSPFVLEDTTFAPGTEGAWSVASVGSDIVLSWTAIPEPATFSLLGTAALVALLRRRTHKAE